MIIHSPFRPKLKTIPSPPPPHRRYLRISTVFHPLDITILIDNREKAPYRFDGYNTESIHLPVGDYAVRGLQDIAVVERKTAEDFVACCGGQRVRFLRELRRLRIYRHAAIIIETDWRTLTKGKWQSQVTIDTVLSSIASWSAEYCPILLAGNRQGGEDAARRFLLSVAKHEHQRLRAFGENMQEMIREGFKEYGSSA